MMPCHFPGSTHVHDVPNVDFVQDMLDGDKEAQQQLIAW